MPFGGNDWLALTEEPTLEPEIPICAIPTTIFGTSVRRASRIRDICWTSCTPT